MVECSFKSTSVTVKHAMKKEVMFVWPDKENIVVIDDNKDDASRNLPKFIHFSRKHIQKATIQLQSSKP